MIYAIVSQMNDSQAKQKQFQKEYI